MRSACAHCVAIRYSCVVYFVLGRLSDRRPSPANWEGRRSHLVLDEAHLSKPFEKLIDIPERAVRDPELAKELFPKWVEQNETVVTNALPMRWRTGAATSEETAPGRRRRGV